VGEVSWPVETCLAEEANYMVGEGRSLVVEGLQPACNKNENYHRNHWKILEQFTTFLRVTSSSLVCGENHLPQNFKSWEACRGGKRLLVSGVD
jgi:hypothetical protein